MQNSSFIKSKIKNPYFWRFIAQNCRKHVFLCKINDSIMTFGTFFILGAIFVDFCFSICGLQRSTIMEKKTRRQNISQKVKVPKIIWDHYSCIKTHVSCSFELCIFKNQDIWFFLWRTNSFACFEFEIFTSGYSPFNNGHHIDMKLSFSENL